uniref:Uncharacterized protein n=1 Tax=Rhizophora mucronata TaxID=61149 RepID=A0A2P2PQV3_RHIMU
MVISSHCWIKSPIERT